MPEPQIEVRFATGEESGKAFYHSWIVYTDENGREFYISAGPNGALGAKMQISQALNLHVADEHSDRSPRLVVEARWDSRFEGDRPADATVKVYEKAVLAEGSRAKAAFPNMRAAAELLNEAQLSYHLSMRNCHAVTATVLKAGGIDLKLPPTLNATSRSLRGIDKPIDLERIVVSQRDAERAYEQHSRAMRDIAFGRPNRSQEEAPRQNEDKESSLQNREQQRSGKGHSRGTDPSQGHSRTGPSHSKGR